MSCHVMKVSRINALASELVNRNKGDLWVPGLGVSFGKEILADKMLAMNLDAFRQRYSVALFFEYTRDLELDRRQWKAESPEYEAAEWG